MRSLQFILYLEHTIIRTNGSLNQYWFSFDTAVRESITHEINVCVATERFEESLMESVC